MIDFNYLDAIGCLGDILSYFLFFTAAKFPTQFNRLKSIGLVLLFSMLDFLLSSVTIDIPEITELLLVVILVLYCRCGFKISWTCAWTSVLLLYGIGGICTLIWMTVLDQVGLGFYDNYALILSLSLVSRFLVFSLTGLGFQKIKDSLESSEWERMLKSCLLPSVIFYGAFEGYFYIQSDTYLLTMLVADFCCFGMYYEIFQQFRMLSELMEERENQALRQIIEEYKIEQSNKTEIFSQTKHDIKNHLATIQTLVKNKENAELERYLQNLTDVTSRYRDIIYTNSASLNAIFNNKVQNYPSIDFNIQVLAPIPEMIEFELSIITFNLLDNAIRYALKSGERKVSFRIRDSNEHRTLELECRNPLCGQSDLVSDKKEEGHGLGIQIIRSNTRKLGGTTEIIQNKQFIFKIKIPNSPSTPSTPVRN
ncbi:sensor histidine kinase [Allobaculum sp. JKK-2023]|uniref:sensor histidine kinase n=1 Tax=Allobaculum sp. JKK-2023 TaxID=3108943 RepID=UPI002B056D4E|nr:GHKL domain-containing protein [Allobaculum sp. JKK-2023]